MQMSAPTPTRMSRRPSWREQRMEEMDPIKKPLFHPYATAEQPLSAALLLPLKLLLCVLFPFRLVLLLVCLLGAGVVGFFGTLGVYTKGQKSCELTGLRRTIVGGLIGLLARGAMLALGCLPGMCQVTGKIGTPAAPIIVAAPHVGLMDGLFFLWHSFPRPVVLEPYTKLPFIASLFVATGGLPVPLKAGKPATATPASTSATPTAGAPPAEEAHKGNKLTNAVRTTILEHKRESTLHLN